MKKRTLTDILSAVQGEWIGGPESLEFERISTDTRSIAKGDLFFALSGERFDAHSFIRNAAEAGASACVVNESQLGSIDAAGPLIAVDDTLKALERLAIFHRNDLSASITAITGSVGKTSTKEFAKTILGRARRVAAAPKSFNNQLGVALTLLGAGDETEELVVELGTSAPGEISHLSSVVRPDRVAITQIAPAHLSGLGDIDGVLNAKSEIFEGLVEGGVSYLCREIGPFEELLSRAPGEVRTYGWERGDFAVTDCRPLDLDASQEFRAGFQFRIEGEELVLPVPGRHNVLNATAAIAVARDVGLNWETIREGLLECRLPPGRLEVDEVGGVRFVDDAYNSNPASFRSALEAFDDVSANGGRRMVVVGDMLELGDESRRFHEEVGRLLSRSSADLVVTLGEESRYVADALEDENAEQTVVQRFSQVEDASAFLGEALSSGDSILFKGSNRSGVRQVASALKESMQKRSFLS